MLTRREFVEMVGGFALIANLRYGRADLQTFVGKSVFDRLLRDISPNAGLAIGDLTGRIGIKLVDTPYAGATLEIDDHVETCSANLLGLDCVTFYEVSLCFARMLRHHGTTTRDLLAEIERVRYRGGKCDGYLSRLHYTCDWIYDNDRKGTVKDLTPALEGALRMDKPFDYMSTHPDAYRQLKSDPSLVPKMAMIEKEVSARKPHFVPNDKIARVEPLLRTGDIIGIATKTAGLDCSHTGLVYVDESGVRRFLNASSVHKKVVLGERLSDYAAKYSRDIGIMVARPL